VAGTVPLWGRCQAEGIQTHAGGRCLSSEATVTSRQRQSREAAQAGLSQAEGIQAAAPGDRRKTGLRVAGGRTGRCGVSPLDGMGCVAPGSTGRYTT